MTWRAVRVLAHIVFHNLCAKLRQTGWEGGFTWHAYAVCMAPVFLLKKYAEEIFPLNSIPLIWLKALAHNLFHKICEEAWNLFLNAWRNEEGDYTSRAGLPWTKLAAVLA